VHTTVYVKMSLLLLSETICRELGIVLYHPNVSSLGNNRKAGTADQLSRDKVKIIQTIQLHNHDSSGDCWS